jgi:predicted RNase H-like nuclease (RuvC/YqgF family)
MSDYTIPTSNTVTTIDPQATKIRELQSDVTQLENRLRALWDKLEGERKCHLEHLRLQEEHLSEIERENERLNNHIRQLELAGNAMYDFINPPSPSMRTTRMDNLLQGWDDAKIGKVVKP